MRVAQTVPQALRTARWMHTGALRASVPRTDEMYREINRAQETYHPHGFQNSAGYRRARKPYFVRNMVTLAGIATFVVGVYSYSIMMVEQDDFSDLDELRVVSDEVVDVPSPDRIAEVAEGPGPSADVRTMTEAATGDEPVREGTPVLARPPSVVAVPRELSPAMNKRSI